MGSLGDDAPVVKVRYLVTGFSAFHGVDKNPTEQVVNEFEQFWKQDGNDPHALCLCSVLRVSVNACDNFLREAAKKVSQEIEDDTVFWIHLGVDPEGTMISLESRAVNNASFLSPDEDGCQFLYQQIDKECPYDQPILTTININSITQKLEQLGISVRKSFDAGKFLCNWIYYRSLRQAQVLSQSNWHSLFVHVPHFHQISKVDQLKIIASLLKALQQEVQHQNDFAVKDSKESLSTATVNFSM